MYVCAKCGSPCPDAIRSCSHNASPILANMSATAISVSNMGENSFIHKIKTFLEQLVHVRF